MRFSSLPFLFGFLPLTLALYFAAPPRWRNLVLLLTSLVFYGWGEPIYLGIMVLSILIDYTHGLLVERYRSRDKLARWFVAESVILNLGLLGFFKYWDFFAENLSRLPGITLPALGLPLPIGISFFTFQTMSYTVDVYRQDAPAQRDIVAFGAYVTMFPQLVAGPIVRYREVAAELKERVNTTADFAAGAGRFTVGLAKKVLLANSIGALWDAELAAQSAGMLTALGGWLGIAAYGFQIYFDFSGYCDIAAGCARLLGLRLPVNFDSPYRSLSVTEFWKRWHMTLTAFLRECVYFPLGGSRRGQGRTYLNILVVYLISGIWHGAGWTFIVWGLLHGAAQVTERLWGGRRDALPKWLRWVMTFFFLNLAWVFFRAPDMPAAAALLKTAVTGGFGGIRPWLVNGLFRREFSALELLAPAVRPYTTYLRVALILGAGLLTALWPRNTVRQMEVFRPTVRSCLTTALLAAWSILSFTGVVTFIYSNF